MNQKVFDKSELADWDELVQFNNNCVLFNYIEAMPKKHHSDASGYTVNKMGEKRKFNIEIKNRKQVLTDGGIISGETYTADTVMIESHKVADLLLDNIIGLEPLYVNFLNNCVIIFNLNKLTVRPEKSNVMNIKSSGYGKFEMAKRLFLSLKDAAIYKDNKLIKKPGEEWEKIQQ